MSDAREASIVAQASAKVTAALFQGTGNLDGFLLAYPRIHQAILAETQGQVGAAVIPFPGTHPSQLPPVPQVPLPDPFPTPGVPAAPVTPQQAQANVMAGFPGTQVVATGIGPDSSSEELWLNFAQNPGDWYNNAKDDGVSHKGGKKPEIKHKTIKKGDYPLGAWLVNGFSGELAPMWAWQAVGVPYPVQP